MIILFNHGLTPEELYTNTPAKVIDKKWRWFLTRYGSSSSYEEAISDPFKYCFGLILHTIIDQKVRFIIPNVPEAYIDFEIVTGEKFEKHRTWGRFEEIDFIESNFTGYALRYYFKAKAYQKSYQIYIGGELKEKFLNGINSGERYYTTKNVTIKDFIEPVHKQFPDLTELEIKKLLLHGFRRMHSAMKFGCAISISTRKFIKCLAYIGKLSLDPATQIKEYSIRRDRKLRKIAGWAKPEYDGWYYIGLNESTFATWVENNIKSRTITRFTNIIPRKLKEELYYKCNHVYIFRFKRDKFKGWSFWAPELKVRNLEYLGEAIERKFYPSDLTWKQLIKEYEKRSS